MDFLAMNAAPEGASAFPAAEHPDAALARGVRQRDRKATAEFVQRFAEAVHRYVHWRLAPHTELADDVAQEVFVSAWQQLASYRGTSSLESWLLGIARHKVEDHYRERLRSPQPWEEAETGAVAETLADLDLELDRERAAAKTTAVLKEIPDHYRAILLWRYWDKRNAREIAEQLNRTEKSVERLLARARERFKRRWLDV